MTIYYYHRSKYTKNTAIIFRDSSKRRLQLQIHQTMCLLVYLRNFMLPKGGENVIKHEGNGFIVKFVCNLLLFNYLGCVIVQLSLTNSIINLRVNLINMMNEIAYLLQSKNKLFEIIINYSYCKNFNK